MRVSSTGWRAGFDSPSHGRSLLPHAESLLERLDDARRDLEALGRLEGGRLRVGAFPTAVSALIPRAMAAFGARHPRVSLSLVEGTTRRQVVSLQAGDVDLAVLSAFPDQTLAADEIELVHLFDDVMLVAVPRSHPCAGRRSVRLSELVDESWIGADSSEDPRLLGPASLGLASELRGHFVVSGWPAKLGLVAAGLGITLVPSLAATGARSDIALVPLHREDCPPRRVYAATPRGVAEAPAVAAFMSVLKETAAMNFSAAGVAANDHLRVVRDVYGAYESGDRDMVERHLADDFTFSAPPDVGIDRATYFERCWPNSETTEAFEFRRLFEANGEVVVTYEATMTDGRRFRNTEIFGFDGAKISRVEVYFGWDVD